MTNSALVQCICGGWMSPHAIYCPTCGVPAGMVLPDVTSKSTKNGTSNSGDVTLKVLTGKVWRLIGMFWTAVAVVIVLLMILA